MGDFFKRNRLRFLLCILALLIGILLYAAMQGGQTTGVMGVVLNPLRQVTQTRFETSRTSGDRIHQPNQLPNRK